MTDADGKISGTGSDTGVICSASGGSERAACGAGDSVSFGIVADSSGDFCISDSMFFGVF